MQHKMCISLNIIKFGMIWIKRVSRTLNDHESMRFLKVYPYKQQNLVMRLYKYIEECLLIDRILFMLLSVCGYDKTNILLLSFCLFMLPKAILIHKPHSMNNYHFPKVHLKNDGHHSGEIHSNIVIVKTVFKITLYCD